MDFNYELEHDLKDLSFYNVENEGTIIVKKPPGRNANPKHFFIYLLILAEHMAVQTRGIIACFRH